MAARRAADQLRKMFHRPAFVCQRAPGWSAIQFGVRSSESGGRPGSTRAAGAPVSVFWRAGPEAASGFFKPFPFDSDRTFRQPLKISVDGHAEVRQDGQIPVHRVGMERGAADRQVIKAARAFPDLVEADEKFSVGEPGERAAAGEALEVNHPVEILFAFSASVYTGSRVWRRPRQAPMHRTARRRPRAPERSPPAGAGPPWRDEGPSSRLAAMKLAGARRGRMRAVSGVTAGNSTPNSWRQVRFPAHPVEHGDFARASARRSP